MKSGKRFSRMVLISLTLLVALSLKTTIVLGFASLSRVDSWPDGWPQELQPYREHAWHWHVMGGVLEETNYFIKFDDRDKFEEIWPVLLKLKSKGAPLHLRSASHSDPTGFGTELQGPMVQIVCPTRGWYKMQPDGTYMHIGQWTKELRLPDGRLPEFVVERKDDGTWVPIEKDSRTVPEHVGILERARVELTLYVDGQVIDLNRIRLPKDAPIIDERILGPQEEDQPQSQETTEQ